MTDKLDIPTGFTPGDWEWGAGIIPPDGPGHYADIYILDADREPITIAEFNDNLPEGRANARLIALAPSMAARIEQLEAEKAELIGAICQYRDDLRHRPAPDSVTRRLEMVAALLAKVSAK